MNLIFDDCKLKMVVDSGLLKFENIKTKKNIKINLDKFSDEIVFSTDNELLLEIVNRVFDNAFNYTPNDGEIAISTEIDNNSCIVEIKDSGPGFPDAYLEKDITLFNPGERHVDDNIGVSLYLVNLVLEYLGGNLKYGNNESGGAFVKLILNSDHL
jgi:K+-sensing histidine kinase KdpD